MFEGGNFVKSKSDTCDQHPLKTLQLHKLCDSVAEPSLPTSARFFILFLRELCATCICVCATCMRNIACTACAHTKKECKLEICSKKKHCFCMVLVLLLHG